MRFVENHDEEPAITAFPGERTKWAATIAATMPGLRFFHEGQFDGRTVRLPVQLGRPRAVEADPDLLEFYRRLLDVLQLPALRDGRYHVIDVEPIPAADGNQDESFWHVLAYRWDHAETGTVVAVIANLSGEEARARVPLSALSLAGRTVDVVDLLNDRHAPMSGDELIDEGLFVTLPAHGVRVISFHVRDPNP